MQWTDSQLQAIEQKKSLLVSAAAGGGKTAVLVERIIRKITDPQKPVDVDRLLVVTFTEAAAQEMRERIRQALLLRLEETDTPNLHRQLALLNRAQISTIHSFCLAVLRRFFYRLDLDPTFRILDEKEASLIRYEVADQLFETRYDGKVPEFADLVWRYGGGRADEALKQIVLSLYSFIQSQIDPEAWLLEAVPGPESKDWLALVKEAARLELKEARDLLLQARRLACLPQGPREYLPVLEGEIGRLSELIAISGQGDFASLSARFDHPIFAERLKPCRDADPGLKEEAQDLRSRAREITRELRETCFSRNPEELILEIELVAPAMTELTRLVADFVELYSEAKRDIAALDFADLERYSLAVLTERGEAGRIRPSEVAAELKKEFVEVLVDEYQDINPVQDAIINLVSRRDNLFMVGDVKQSIYRFRLAEPDIFRTRYEDYRNSQAADTASVDLASNFRSRTGVIAAVNSIFNKIMTPGVGGVDYQRPGATLKAGACYPEAPDLSLPSGPAELHLIERKQDGDEARGALELEAAVVAERIGKMVACGLSVWDKDVGKYRAIRYRDIAVLMRSTRDRVNTVLEVFRQWGIPAYAELGTGYFSAGEVETIMALLKIIDNPRQDIPLAAVLRSPIVGLSDEELAEIRLAKQEGSFWEAVLARVQGDGELPDTLCAFTTRLAHWREMARQLPLPELIWRLYRETGYLDYAAGMPGGIQRRANLLALHDLARQFSQFAEQSLFRFLRFVERLKERDEDFGEARALSQNEDVVQVMSVHKSKGLEFPVVFVVDLGKDFNLEDARGDILVHRRLGLGPVFVDYDSGYKYPTLAHRLVSREIRRDSLSEEVRILYVALTRAREKLVLVGSVRNLDTHTRKWCQRAVLTQGRLPESWLLAAQNYLDWICPAVAADDRAGEVLRGFAGIQNEAPEEMSELFSLTLWGTGDRPVPLPGQARSQIETPVAPPGDILKLISDRFSWEYRSAATLPAQVTVTGLTRNPLEAYRTMPRPEFLREKIRPTGADIGTATHLFIRHLDLSATLDRKGIERQLKDLVERGLLKRSEAKALDLDALVRFFATPLGRRLVRARKSVRREQVFTMAKAAGELYDLAEDPAAKEKVLIQGVIDCLFEKGDGFVVLDFKTDYVRPGADVWGFAEKYMGQVRLYAEAVEKIYDKPVRDAYLCFLRAGVNVKVDIHGSH